MDVGSDFPLFLWGSLLQDGLVTNKPPGMRFTARRNMRGPDGLPITFTIPTALMPFRCQVQMGAQGDQLHRVGQPPLLHLLQHADQLHRVGQSEGGEAAGRRKVAGPGGRHRR